MANLEKMSKKQLEAYARKELGVELDRRHSKKQLLAKVQGLLEDQEEEVEVSVSNKKKKYSILRLKQKAWVFQKWPFHNFRNNK